jgi:hypothetical protein
MEKSAGIGNIGEEELTRLRLGRQSLGDVEGTLKTLIGQDVMAKMKASDIEKMKKLFIMAGANITQAPNLTKEAKAKNVCAFFEKLSSAHLTDAQIRYPELQKVANSGVNSTFSTTSSSIMPDMKPKRSGLAQGKIPTQSSMSGGAA